ncbi:MAG: sugar ABC transporter permease [Actinobacteria bacterium]|nr:sugar ABC transporter permease [Actinomycetota bacterium]
MSQATVTTGIPSQAGPKPAPPTPKRRKLTPPQWMQQFAWRHVVMAVAAAYALFPVAYVFGAAFNPVNGIGGTEIWPKNPTLDNFRNLLTDPNQPFANWYRNGVIVAACASVFNVLLGSCAAYAFSRFRFKGRKVGMMTLLFVQMFPSFLALTAIYIIMGQVQDVFPAIGLDSLGGLMLVYLAGAMGVNAWFLKGFFDTVPMELDESAKVDGATHGQIFWGIILPLSAPVLSVTGLLGFTGTLNEYVLASRLIQNPEKRTLAMGLQQFINGQFDKRWGTFSAGALLAGIPVIIIFLILQRNIVSGLTQGSVKG